MPSHPSPSESQNKSIMLESPAPTAEQAEQILEWCCSDSQPVLSDLPWVASHGPLRRTAETVSQLSSPKVLRQRCSCLPKSAPLAPYRAKHTLRCEVRDQEVCATGCRSATRPFGSRWEEVSYNRDMTKQSKRLMSTAGTFLSWEGSKFVAAWTGESLTGGAEAQAKQDKTEEARGIDSGLFSL